MTHEEIESYRKRLQEILAKYEDVLKNNTGDAPVREELRTLARETGASQQALWGISDRDATVSELAHNIYQALQTASMIDACRTAAENVDVAKQAQRDASRSQQVAFWSMLAAWGAVVVNIVVAYIMAAMK
jgi:hypothetical protein